VARIELRRSIKAPPEKVWSIISDLSGQVRWMEDVHSLQITSERKSGAGTVIAARTKLFGLPVLRDVMEVTSWDEPRELAVEHRGAFTGRGAFHLEPQDGGTVFVWEEVFDPPLGPLGEFAVLAAVAPYLRWVWGRSMENVRRLAESPGPA
jgi:uncharacterized protein YndB with AHSA1/START domain